MKSAQQNLDEWLASPYKDLYQDTLLLDAMKDAYYKGIAYQKSLQPKTLKQAIKHGINSAKGKWKATKVWPVKVDEQTLGNHTMWIEVNVKPQKK